MDVIEQIEKIENQEELEEKLDNLLHSVEKILQEQQIQILELTTRVSQIESKINI